MKKELLLGSQSQSRKDLLTQAGIAFKSIGHTADEQACDWGMPLAMLVQTIAEHKMASIMVPKGSDGDMRYVLTADTLGQDAHGVIHGKPSSYQDAVAMIKALRGHGIIATAFCLNKVLFKEGAWHMLDARMQCVEARYEFTISDKQIEEYLAVTPGYISYAGAFSVEGYGAQFIVSINGSYTTILGLPMAELRQALEQLGFFN